MNALELRWKIRQLQRKHGIVPQPHLLPSTAPVAHAMILIGLAATTDLDADRMKLAPFAFGPTLPDCRNLPLLRHHDPTIRVGSVQELSYDQNGNLRCRARVEPVAAHLAAFSVGLRILECELHDADSEDFYGLLKRVELTEVTVTDSPANPNALVENRIPASLSDFYTNAARGMRAINEILVLMKGQLHAQANPQ